MPNYGILLFIIIDRGAERCGEHGILLFCRVYYQKTLVSSYIEPFLDYFQILNSQRDKIPAYSLY